MSVHLNKARDNWFSKWRENGKEKRKYFKSRQEAEAFERDRLQALIIHDDRMTLGEIAVSYFRSRPDYNEQTKGKLVRFLSEGPGAFMRDKFAESLNRQDLETMRNALRERGAGNNTINKYQAYIRAILRSVGIKKTKLLMPC